LGNIDAARQHYDDALPLYEAERAQLGKANTLKSLGDLESRLGNIDAARQHYDDALLLYEREQDPVGKMNVFIGQARLLADQGAINEALAQFSEVFTIAESIGFANHPVTQDLRQEAEALHRLHDQATPIEDGTLDQSQLAENPLAQALSALLQVKSTEALAQTVAKHPILLELDAFFALAALLEQARAAGQSDALAHPLALLITLMQQYNERHATIDDPAEQQRYVELHRQLLPLADALDAEALGGALRHVAASALKTLGNFFVPDDEPREDGPPASAAADPQAALAAYTEAIAYVPTEPVFYRNRAGLLIELGEFDAAEADINAATTLDPSAERLTALQQELATARQKENAP